MKKPKRNEFRSKLEWTVALQLWEHKVPFEYESQWFELWTTVSKGFCKECLGEKVQKVITYTPDFFLPNGIILEVKGYFKADFRKKLAAFREMWPEKDLRLVFGSNNKLHRRSDLRYSDWCESHNWLYAVKEVPQEWLN